MKPCLLAAALEAQPPSAPRATEPIASWVVVPPGQGRDDYAESLSES